MEDARRLEDAGATLLLIEAVPEAVTKAIVAQVQIPVIGCGAGPACHGQVVVTQDLMGLTSWQPAFAQPLASLGQEFLALGIAWRTKVAAGDLGTHPYHMADGEKLVEIGDRTPSSVDRSPR